MSDKAWFPSPAARHIAGKPLLRFGIHVAILLLGLAFADLVLWIGPLRASQAFVAWLFLLAFRPAAALPTMGRSQRHIPITKLSPIASLAGIGMLLLFASEHMRGGSITSAVLSPLFGLSLILTGLYGMRFVIEVVYGLSAFLHGPLESGSALIGASRTRGQTPWNAQADPLRDVLRALLWFAAAGSMFIAIALPLAASLVALGDAPDAVRAALAYVLALGMKVLVSIAGLCVIMAIVHFASSLDIQPRETP